MPIKSKWARRTRHIVSSTYLSLFLVQAPNAAGVNCELTQFEVETYDHGGVYVHGVLAGQWVNWIAICGGSTWSQTDGMDCSGPATKNRLAVTVAAQLAARSLNLFFGTLSSCSEVKPYMRPQGIRLKT